VTRNVSVDTGPSRYTQNTSIAAIALTLGASSSHDEKLLVAARSTSLINFRPRRASSLAGTWRNPAAIPKEPDQRRVDSR
jgi:hypothetical protein